MPVLELARKTFAGIKTELTGQGGGGVPPQRTAAQQVQVRDKSDRSDQRAPHVLVQNPTDLAKVLVALEKDSLIALDLETNGLNPCTDSIRLLSLSFGNDASDPTAYLVDWFAVDASPLLKVLTSKNLVIHNAAFDLGFLNRSGFTPAGKVCDTMHLSQLLTAGTRESNGLEVCCDRYLGRKIDKTEQQSDWSGELTANQLAYAAADVAVLIPLYKTLLGKIDQAKLLETAAIERRCLRAIVWMSQHGVGFDRNAWLALANVAKEEAEKEWQRLNELAPQKPGDSPAVWNWKSPKQAAQALNLAGCEVADTADETLAALDHPLAQQLRRYRKASRRTDNYGTAWLDHLQADGRIYPKWRQIGAATGRMSCSDPNMQQLPRGDCRRCIVAPLGRVLVKADYSQIELRIAAKVSGDEALLAAYRRGDDLHTITASKVLEVDEVTKEDRQLAKALNFGLLYGMGADSFRRYAKSDYGLDLTEEKAKRYHKAFFDTYPGLAKWHRSVRAKITKETRTLAGRRLLTDHKTTSNLRLNAPIQGTGADGLKLALALLWERRNQVPGAFPVLAVHDEIVIEADADQAAVAAAWLKAAMMDGMVPLIDPVPVEVEVKVSRTWGKD
jgi:DNA polymerase-1